MDVVKGPDTIREEAFIALVEAEQTSLLRMCYMVLRDREAAQDAVQETFLKAYRALGQFRGQSSGRTWLVTIAMNTCRDMRRSAWLRYMDRRVTPEDLPEAATPPAEDDRELTLRVMQLPDKLREVIVLYYYQDMNTVEMARSLGLPQSTVATRLKRAREKLREVLEGGDPS